ncbi:MAG TPA: GPGG-motif small membrane protein [Actinomycetota bacterium]|nr:GPGG-motif small membrane protein [Actinomycetota bacterium]
MGTVLWILAVILAIVGVIQILQGQLIFGIILLILAAAVGPGGWSIFNRRGTV